MNKVAIGIDIGGTSVKLGVVDSREILARSSFLTPKAQSRGPMLELLYGHIRAFLDQAKIEKWTVAGVGIGAPGPIDVERGFVYLFPNIPGWKNTPLKDILEKKLKMTVRVDNDASVMALAEFYFGAGKGYQNGIALTLGTGVGGGIFLNGKLFHGHSHSAAEIGHMIIDRNGPLCSCGRRGCLETFVGNGYLVKEIQKRLKSGQKSILTKWLKEGEILSPMLLGKASRAGDHFAINLWGEIAESLGIALSSLVDILNPEVIILGGGVAQNQIIFPYVLKAVRKRAFPISTINLKILPARLGVDAGLVGASALATS